ncbi:hypothetical protein [Prescottella equi]
MNLAWIAAILRPRDIAPHGNFDDRDYELLGPPQLAGAIVGEEYPRTRPFDTSTDSAEAHPWVKVARRSLVASTQAQAAHEIADLVTGSGDDDIAFLAAIGLIGCVAASELDDYETCNRILDRLDQLVHGTSDDELLIRAIVLQQRSLRKKDTGQDNRNTVHQTIQALDKVRSDHCTPFALNPGTLASYSYVDTIDHIVLTVRRAAWSISPTMDLADEREGSRIPDWREQVRSPRSEQLLLISQQSAAVLQRQLKQSFDERMRSRSIAIGGAPIDLYYPTLLLELNGHSTVYAARRDLALMRFIRPPAEGNGDLLADALRSLRNSGFDKELDLAIEHLRAAGPLSALSSDARKILRGRSGSYLLRVSELRVLAASAELLTEQESSRALDAVLAALDSGGPRSAVGHWQAWSHRMEAAWQAASVLANPAGRQQVVADRLHDEIGGAAMDQYDDRTIARAVYAMDWTKISSETVGRWRSLLSSRTEEFPVSGSALEAVCEPDEDDRVVPIVRQLRDISDVATMINMELSSPRGMNDQWTQAEALVIDELQAIRQRSRGLEYRSGGFSCSDLAAAILGLGYGSDALWASLSSYLTDTEVPRDERSAAFDRLAREAPELPNFARSLFKEQAQTILESLDAPTFMQDSINPYSPALRFLMTHRLIDDSTSFSGIAQLAGSSNPTARENGLRSVEFASDSVRDLSIPLALQLSYDEDVRVKAQAARVLTQFSGRRQELTTAAERRLLELLQEDGLLIPLNVIRAIRFESISSEVVRSEIQRLSLHHPSRRIREEASRRTV